MVSATPSLVDKLTSGRTPGERAEVVRVLQNIAEGASTDFVLATLGQLLGDYATNPAEMRAFQERFKLDWGKLYSLFENIGMWVDRIEDDGSWLWLTSEVLDQQAGFSVRQPLEAWQRPSTSRGGAASTSGRGDLA